MGRELMFSVGGNDLVWEFFRCGGKGGQKQNKTESGARVRHPESGAVAESRTHRDQIHNRREALRRMTETDEFKSWTRMKSGQVLITEADIKREVERSMDERNLVVEVGDGSNWRPE